MVGSGLGWWAGGDGSGGRSVACLLVNHIVFGVLTNAATYDVGFCFRRE